MKHPDTREIKRGRRGEERREEREEERERERERQRERESKGMFMRDVQRMSTTTKQRRRGRKEEWER
jgi:hypothetical protein